MMYISNPFFWKLKTSQTKVTLADLIWVLVSTGLVPQIVLVFCQMMEKQSTNQSFVAKIKAGEVTFYQAASLKNSASNMTHSHEMDAAVQAVLSQLT